MKQLVLDIAPPPAPTLENFVPGRNAEALAAVRAWAAARGADGERFVYLWGAAASGRSHLLRAAAAAANALAFEPARVFDVPENAHVTADGVHALDAQAQVALFNLHNRLRAGGGALLSCGDAPPAQLGLRDDVRTRLAAGLVYELHALDDAEKAEALTRHARARGFTLPPEVADYVLRHARRDLGSLIALLEALDRHSLAAKRAVTLPLVRELLKERAAP